jgi:hypothetical protein
MEFFSAFQAPLRRGEAQALNFTNLVDFYRQSRIVGASATRTSRLKKGDLP